MDYMKEFLGKKDVVKKIIIIAVMFVLFYVMRRMMNLLLLTFIIIYLINQLQIFFVKNIRNVIPVNDRVVTGLIYTVILILLAAGVYSFAPKMIEQGHEIMVNIKAITDTQDKNSYANSKLGKEIISIIGSLPANIDIYAYVEGFASGLIRFFTNVGRWGLNIFAALVLSFFFMIDKDKIMNFVRRFKQSKISFIYEGASTYYKIFLSSFGKVLQAQIMIAFINTILTTIGLILMGFPGIFFLGVMIFILSLIPVAGVIISFIPLSLIAFKIGGLIKILYVLGLILIIHMIENYFLNPNLMSYKTKLPVFITLIILFISEHIFGAWGLIFGLPIFMFILELIRDKTPEAS